MDDANGFDFTGKGIKDPSGKAITGYGYVATDDYPWSIPYLYGTVANCDSLTNGNIVNDKFTTGSDSGGSGSSF